MEYGLIFAASVVAGCFLKFLARSLGLILVAAGFVGLVIDGTRSIVNNSLSFVTLEADDQRSRPGGTAALQSASRPGAHAACGTRCSTA